MSDKAPNRGRGSGPAGGGFGGGFGRPAEKAKDFKGTLKRLIGYLKPHKRNLLIVLIFAIASTSFTIAAPKVTSKAMNNLQNSYMARKMLAEMAKGQNEAIDQMKNKMEDVQKEAIDQINTKMSDGQKKAVDQITVSMADAQAKAVDEIYKAMAIQLHQGVASGQKTAVDKITAQMAAVQKGLVAQIKQQMQQAQQAGIQTPPMDPQTLDAIQRLLKLPMIDSFSDRQSKVKTTLEFIDILKDLPSNGQIDAKSLSTIEELLKLPMLEAVKNPDQK
ncbi:MAG TPA: hypothetical protein VNU93_02165, partial [Verrucomicrobiae bacterium]|nr:hypothetical protein [Verrucomicrobiae bacterium]